MFLPRLKLAIAPFLALAAVFTHIFRASGVTVNAMGLSALTLSRLLIRAAAGAKWLVELNEPHATSLP
jgi:hypothetical protein